MNSQFQFWETPLQTAIQKLHHHLTLNLRRLDSSKVNLMLLEQIKIPYFESPTAVRFLVNVRREPNGVYCLVPYDKKFLKPIYEAIVAFATPWQVLLQPTLVQISLPPLTTTKKMLLQKQYKQIGEQSHIQLRQLRQQTLQKIKQHFPGENVRLQAQKQLEKLIQTANAQITAQIQQTIKSLEKV